MRKTFILVLFITFLLPISADAQEGIVSHWSFDNSANPGQDEVGGNDGTVYGATWTADGVKNGALSFDGEDDYVDCGNDSSLDFSTENFSISLWVKPRSTYVGGSGSGTNVSAILDKGTGFALDGYGIWFSGRLPNNVRKIAFVTDGDGDNEGWSALYTYNVLELNRWYHIVAVRKDDVKYIYINGNQEPRIQEYSLEISDPSRPLIIGKHERGGSGGWFNGMVDEMTIYNRALNDQEILELYKQETGRYSEADLNNDGEVNILDMSFVGIHLGLRGSDSGWNITADVILDGEIDIYDIVFIASRFDIIKVIGPSYWSLDGNRTDAWGGIKGIMYGATWGTGVSGNALEFDGIDDYFEVYHDDYMNVSDELTVSAWVNITDDGTYHPIVVKSAGLASGYHLVVGSGARLYLRTGGNGNYSDVLTSFSDYYGDWHHVAGVFNGTDEILYIDGVEKNRETPVISTINPSTSVLRIGRSTTGFWGGDTRLNGLVDEVRVYNRALTQEEIIEVMNDRPLPPSPPIPPPTGNVIYAETGEPADVQNAVNLASDGQIVQIPAGVFPFDEQVNVPGGIHLRGEGKDKTILKRTIVDRHNLIIIDCNGKDAKFSEIKLQGLGDELTAGDSGLGLNDCRNFKVWNSEFQGFSSTAVGPWGYSYGVIYNNSFIENYMPGLGYGVHTSGGGDVGWNRSFELGQPGGPGGNEWVFVEDNYFRDNRHAMDSSWGGRIVGRYNILERYRRGDHMIKAHGTTSRIGTRGFEYYNNILIGYIPGGRPDGFTMGGGSGVIYNNTMINVGSGNRTIGLAVHGTDTEADYPALGQPQDVYIWGNTRDGELWDIVGLERDYDIKYLQEGRDYFIYEMPGYVPYPYPHPLREGL
jgi:hypothetical protein